MKVSPYLNINRIEFIVTYYCTGKCIHCSVGDKLNRSDGHKCVDIEQAINAIKQLTQLFTITSIMTFGGEPLIFPDVVCDIHRTAASCGIGTRQIITNGYFTKNEKRILEVAESLNDSGVNDLLISVDSFHQQVIPINYVYQFAKHIKQTGLPNVQLQPAWLVNKAHDNPYNAKTKEILNEFSDLGIPISSGNDIFMSGNASKYLSEYYAPPALNMCDTCGSQPYTEPLNNITSLSIVPDGNIMACGFTIGNIYKESVEDIVSRYNPYDNIYMNALLSGGASALSETAKSNGISVNCSECYSICDLCHKVNEQI